MGFHRIVSGNLRTSPLEELFGRRGARGPRRDGLSRAPQLRRKRESAGGPPIDVYDAAAWMAVTCLSEESVALGGAPVCFPDFTGGKWIGGTAFFLSEQSGSVYVILLQRDGDPAEIFRIDAVKNGAAGIAGLEKARAGHHFEMIVHQGDGSVPLFLQYPPYKARPVPAASRGFYTGWPPTSPCRTEPDQARGNGLRARGGCSRIRSPEAANTGPFFALESSPYPTGKGEYSRF